MSAAADLLPGFLELAVATEWEWARAMTEEERVRFLHHAFPQGISEAVLYRVPGKTALAFAELARCVALAAHQPGGIRLMGLRWTAETGPWPQRDEHAPPDFRPQPQER